MADDEEGVIRERLYLDKDDPSILRNEMTVTDNSLERPWTVMKRYKKQPTAWWSEDNCVEDQTYVTLGKEVYMVHGDGSLMPMKKGQPPPDLKYFGK